jgi:hypothetical protein
MLAFWRAVFMLILKENRTEMPKVHFPALLEIHREKRFPLEHKNNPLPHVSGLFKFGFFILVLERSVNALAKCLNVSTFFAF